MRAGAVPYRHSTDLQQCLFLSPHARFRWRRPYNSILFDSSTVSHTGRPRYLPSPDVPSSISRTLEVRVAGVNGFGRKAKPSSSRSEEHTSELQSRGLIS